jgi:hypothetical protein
LYNPAKSLYNCPSSFQIYRIDLRKKVIKNLFMEPTTLFSSTKAGHIGQILSTALFGQVVSNSLTPPAPGQIELYGHLVIQVLVAVVTIWATIRKALQKPEAMVKVPADVVPVISAAVVPSGSAVPASGDGDAE